MFEKLAIAIFLVLFSLSLAACSDKEKPPAINNIKTGNNYNAPKIPNISNDIMYKVTELTYEKNDTKIKCNIKYLKVSDLSDVKRQEQINNILKDEALKVFRYYDNSDGILELNISYKIVLMDKDILSIQYSGIGYVSTAAHPNNLFYTTNINMRTGNKLRLNDIINIDKDFAEKFISGKFKALEPHKNEAIKHLSIETILAYFKEADSLDNTGSNKQSDVFSYLTPDSLGISISISHSTGDHAEFEIKYKDIKDNIKVESDIWNNLLRD
ncbi:MAG TPA: hypothetical protein VF941_15980 [Clostridia bacterium]